jgi:hypothetical protein
VVDVKRSPLPAVELAQALFGMGYKEMITGKYIPSREKGPEPGKEPEGYF